MVVASTCYCLLGWRQFLESLGLSALGGRFPYRVPPLAFMLIFILAAVIALAVSIMAGWHLWSIAKGETSVEGQDHEHYRKMARGRGEVRFSWGNGTPANGFVIDHHRTS
jgi:palmitoyltransferase